ncbi:hypothetical protein M3J09_011979 [Ascochyta lentis]
MNRTITRSRLRHVGCTSTYASTLHVCKCRCLFMFLIPVSYST